MNGVFSFCDDQMPGTIQDDLQIFNIEMKSKMKSQQIPAQVSGVCYPTFRYEVERMDGDLWGKVLDPENGYRRQLIDQVDLRHCVRSRALSKFQLQSTLL